MAPTKFKDLNKSAKDLLTKDYTLDGTSVEINSTAEDGTSFKGTAVRKSERIGGDLEVGHKIAKGLKLTETWSSNGNLNNKLEYSKIKNLKLTGEVLLKTTDMSNQMSLSAAYTNCAVNFNAKLSPALDMTVDATVTPRSNIILGVQSGYGLRSGKVAMPSMTAAYKKSDFSLVGGLSLAKGTLVTADAHHKINGALQMAYNVKCNVDKSTFDMAAGIQYNVTKSTFYKARVNNKGVMAVSYSQFLSDKVKLTMSAEMRSPSDHKVGASVVFN